MKTDIQADVNLTGDETLIMRMILNLLTNGIKYSKNSNTDEEDRWVSLRLKEKNNRIIIDVEDNGIGIKEEELENIFHRFYKVDKSRAGEDDSFGLGLSMVRWIAQAHGGIVSVQSSFGKGSRFTVELP